MILIVVRIMIVLGAFGSPKISEAQNAPRTAIQSPLSSFGMRTLGEDSHCLSELETIGGELSNTVQYNNYSYVTNLQSYGSILLSCELLDPSSHSYHLSAQWLVDRYSLDSDNQFALANRKSSTNTQSINFASSKFLGPILIALEFSYLHQKQLIESYDIELGESMGYGKTTLELLLPLDDIVLKAVYSPGININGTYTSVRDPAYTELSVITNLNPHAQFGLQWSHQKFSRIQQWSKDRWNLRLVGEWDVEFLRIYQSISYSPAYYADPIDATSSNLAQLQWTTGAEYDIDDTWTVSTGWFYLLGESINAENATLEITAKHRLYGLTLSMMTHI